MKSTLAARQEIIKLMELEETTESEREVLEDIGQKLLKLDRPTPEEATQAWKDILYAEVRLQD